ncbi:sucrose synthase, partial [Pseudanabaenaceae cyanobacterium LEGE 13415]|nr:sucrose synthase [Pseudanabaenaceae cyanobacterium LEGE 13415]
MSDLINAVLNSDEKSDLRQFTSVLRSFGKRYLLRNEILQLFDEFYEQYKRQNSSQLENLIRYVQEIIVEEGGLYFIIRPKIARQEAYRLLEDLTVEPITIQELLDIRDRFVNHYHPQEGDVFEIDFAPFYDYSPVLRDPKNIGKGVELLNRYLSNQIFQDSKKGQEPLFQFLQLHQYNGIQLLINGRIRSSEELSDRVKQALGMLSDRE